MRRFPAQEDIERIEFPVMVKPVDNGGGVGMSVCYGREELEGCLPLEPEARIIYIELAVLIKG